ncbi:MAG: helix-turn-helix domain-containing protein, partial [Myxococcota bacterium]
LFAREIPTPARRISPEAGARMQTYEWPGNVRELENKLRQAVLIARDSELTVDDLFLQHPAAPDKVPSFKEAKREFERQYISQLLRVSHGNISRAARLAQKDRKDFYDVMRRNGINPKTFRGKDVPTG